jgi:hypothetical protein
MIALVTQLPVHTVGINWSSVLTIVGSVVVIMSTVLGFLAKLITVAITKAIDKLRIDVIDGMEKRLSLLEQIVLRRRRRNII